MSTQKAFLLAFMIACGTLLSLNNQIEAGMLLFIITSIVVFCD